jgi:hypothetical protein
MNSTILKIILVLLIVTSIVYVLLIRCREHFLDLDLNADLLKNNDNIIIFKNKIECLDTVKLKILNNSNEELHLLNTEEKTKLNNTAKIMCNEVCDESICTYKKTDDAPPSRITTLKSIINENNVLTLSWMPPKFTDRYICIINFKDTNRIHVLNNEANSDVIEHEISDLNPGESYKISIIAENSNGLSDPITKIITIPNIPTDPTSSISTSTPNNSYDLTIPIYDFKLNSIEKLNIDF